MANLRVIKKRILSAQSTSQITHTMEMVSSAKIRKATDRILAATPYSNAMQEMLHSIATHAAPKMHPLLEARVERSKATFIVVVSDRGLAGGFNSSVLHAAQRAALAYKEGGVDVEFILCGKKAVGFFAYRGIEPVLSYTELSADPTIKQAREIAHYVRKHYEDCSTDEVVLFYNHARNAADQDLITETILPITDGMKSKAMNVPDLGDKTSAIHVGGQEQVKNDLPMSYEYEPDSEEVLSRLLPNYLETMIYRALLDSAAAEQGARRKAMKSATDNATEIISTLQRSYNRARQAAITTELNEIVAGAAALEA